jgi:hypothetical protein
MQVIGWMMSHCQAARLREPNDNGRVRGRVLQADEDA